MSSICLEKDAVLSLVTVAVRLQICLRMPSGAELMSWANAPPYLRLGDLQIPGARASYKVLKHSAIIEDHARIWREGEASTVDLTMVKCCSPHFVLHLYVCLEIDNDYTAYRLPGSSVRVPAATHKVPARDGLRVLYDHLLSTGDEAICRLVTLLREDLTARQVLRRNFLQFATGKNEGHLGHVKAIVMLDEDIRFVFRLDKAYWVLVDDPTQEQTQTIKAAILEISAG